MELRNLQEADYAEALTMFEALDALHIQARPDCFVCRENVYPKEHYISAVNDPECLLLGAFTDEGPLVGILRATLWNESGMVKGTKTVCLDDIYVCPEYRRRGVAGKLFQAAEDWACRNGAVRMDLHVWGFNRDAISLYKAMGMDWQRHVMEKTL